jgi:acetyl esterase/lipase
MPSIRARLTNVFLRLTVRPMWKPGVDIHRIRAMAAKMDARIGRKPALAPFEDTEVAGVRATWVGEPGLAARGTLLYLHGGAWSIHLPAIYRRFVTTLSNATGLRVQLVDYRLAPEHPFPAATDDCLAVYRWLVDNGFAQRPFAVAGDSAGGNLTLVTLMRARDAGLPMPNCAVALSPATDLTMSGPSMRYNADADVMFSLPAAEVLPALYCAPELRADPHVSPLFGNWQGLPPLLFHAGSTEALLDDSVRAQDRAVQAGSRADIEVWQDLPHVFHVFHWLPEAVQGIRGAADFIRSHTASHAAAPSEIPEAAPMAAETSTAGREHSL